MREESQGTRKQSTGTCKRSPGTRELSPEKLKTLITLLFLSFERREKIYVITTYSTSESAKNLLKWTHTFILIVWIVCICNVDSIVYFLNIHLCLRPF